MNKKGWELAASIVSVMLVVVMIGVFKQVFSNSNERAYVCTATGYPYSVNTSLCMNTSSVGNSSNYQAATYTGANAVETILFGLISLVLIIGTVIVFIKRKK